MRTVALVAGGERFEDFFDKIGVSLETFRDEFTGGWLFNYVRALGLCGVRTVLLFTSARVDAPVHFVHADSGVPVWVVPAPRLPQRIRRVQQRYLPSSDLLVAAASYCATPLWSMARILRQEQCDAILCQEYEQPRFDAFVLLGRLIGLPVFASYQGANETGTWLERPIRRLSVRLGAGLIIASDEEIERVRTAYHVASRKIGRIPNPVEVVNAPPSERQTARAGLGIGSLAWSCSDR
jgi:hypothetical protein